MLKTNIDELEALMKDFYILTGIKMVLFDEHKAEILAYPNDKKTFCSYMRLNNDFNNRCTKSDADTFELCKRSKKVIIYKCHAGLVEAVAPILEKNIIIGYLMFGQVCDIKDKALFLSALFEKYPSYANTEKFLEYAKKIKYKKNDQLLAATKILDACTSYILLKEFVKPSKDELKSKLINYINKNLSENIGIMELSRQFKISRTALYDLLRPLMPNGISAYIKNQRLSYAKKLLEETDMNICSICSKVGFSDYNYFIRAFKSAYGISPKKLRKVFIER